MICMMCPEVIVIGGGVLKRKSLFPKIRKACLESLNGYIGLKGIVGTPEKYIVPAFYDDNTGVVGSLEMAVQAIDSVPILMDERRTRGSSTN